MLQKINGSPEASAHLNTAGAALKIKDAAYPAPFESGLEYSPPARGTWNIVHTTMLVPESHQVYICAAGCLRGVVLTAAEMGCLDRFSSILVEENNLMDGSMEALIEDGIDDILQRLPKKPRFMFIYPACVHRFMGTDLDAVLAEVRRRHPEIGFSLCCMDPIMRKSGLTAEARTRWQIYSFLKPVPHDPKAVNIIGNNLPTKEDSELVRLIKDNGFTLRDLTLCHTAEEYLEMSKSFLNVSYNPLVTYGAAQLEETLGQKNLYLPLSFDCLEIRAALYQLADTLGVPRPDYTEAMLQLERSLFKAKLVIGATPVAIDYTATFRPFSLAKQLLYHEFNVTRIYTDLVAPEDKKDFEYLQEHYPDVEIYSTLHHKMRVLPRHEEQFLAIGQKAAYFTGTRHFVNIAECGGLYGFSGLSHLAQLMVEAYLTEKEAKEYIQTKGWGCNLCQ
jgi:hypothetical protein